VSIQSRPESKESIHQSRPNSRASVRSIPDSRVFADQSRPGSRASIESGTDSKVLVRARPDSKASVQSRPASRMSNVQGEVLIRPVSRKSLQSCDQAIQTLEMSELLDNKTRPSSRSSLHSTRSCKSSGPMKILSSNEFEVKCNNSVDDISTPNVICSNVRSDSTLSTSKLQQCVLGKNCFTKGMILTSRNHIGKS